MTGTEPRRGTRGRWLALPLFLAVALGLYANALSNPFHYDDRHSIVENPYLRDPANISGFFDPATGRREFSPAEPDAIHYRPLLLASYALNFRLGGEDTVGFHLYNILLHALSALAVAALALALGLEGPWALGVGLLFLADPFHTEAVNYISARSSLQSGLLMLASLLAFLRARRGNERRWLWLAAALAAAAGALLTKEVAVTLPLMYLLHDLLYPPRREDRWGLNGYGLDLLLLGGGLAYLVAGGQATYFAKVLMGQVGPRGFLPNLWLQAHVLVRFIGLTLLPAGLSIVHEFPDAAHASASGAACVAFLGAVTVAAVFLRRRLPLFAFGWGLFLLALAPTTLLPMNTPLQESRGYAAAAGLLLALAALVRAGLGNRPTRGQVAAGALILALFAVGTVTRNPVWSSDLRLWTDAVAKAPGAFRAHANLGTAYHAGGNPEAAVREYRAAIALFPGEAAVHADLGGALLDLNRLDEARQALQAALKITDRYAPAHYKYAILLERTGDPVGARNEYERAIQLVPTYAEALVNLGILRARGGDVAAGIGYMERALAVRPGDPALYVNLMIAYRQTGDRARADALYGQARERGTITPRLTRLYRAFGPPPPARP